jgi:LPS export ABC transporter protein LptC
LVAVVLLAAIGYASVVVYRRHDGRPRRPRAAHAAPEGDRPLIEVDQPVLEQYGNGGQLAWRIKLDQISLRSGGGLVEAQRIKEGIVYDDAGAPAVRVSAERAQLNVASKDFVISGRCRAVTQTGAVMTTEKVQWINAERKLHFPDEVVLRHRDVVITTRGMGYTPDDATARAPGQVRARTTSNTVIGRNLEYNLSTGDLALDQPAIIVRDTDEAQRSLDQLR